MEARNAIAVCGTFDRSGGKPSGYMREFFKDSNAEVHNGGSMDSLKRILKGIKKYSIVYWFPNISNDEEKIVSRIKKENPTCSLITSKNNRDGTYSDADLVTRALKTRSALLVEITVLLETSF